MSNPALLETQPHSSDAERTVIGALLLDPEAIFTVDAKLTPNDFYDPAYRAIYAAIQQLAEKGSPIDFVTVADRLSDDKKIDQLGGSAFLASVP